jgi:hypothetical protein
MARGVKRTQETKHGKRIMELQRQIRMKEESDAHEKRSMGRGLRMCTDRYGWQEASNAHRKQSMHYEAAVKCNL